MRRFLDILDVGLWVLLGFVLGNIVLDLLTVAGLR